jgi:hypothetical protein
VLLCGTAGAEEESTLVPPAPADGQPLSYDIPLSPDLADSVVALRTAFAEGLAAEARALLDTRLTGQAALLADVADGIEAAGAGIPGKVDAIGNADATFGIDGITRLQTNQSAERDTIFGFVMWHEEPWGESMQIAQALEDRVGTIGLLGSGVSAVAYELAGLIAPAREAVESGDTARLLAASRTISVTSERITAVAQEVDGIASDFDALVQKIQAGKSYRVDEDWDEVRAELAEALTLSRTMAALAPQVLATGYALGDLSEALQKVEWTVSTFSDSVDTRTGMHYVTWEVFQEDLLVVSAFAAYIAGSPSGVYSGDALAHIQGLFNRLVLADRLIADRAVEVTRLNVWEAADALEAHYMEDAGYDADDSERDRQRALERVDVAMRRNLDLQSALIGSRAARAALEDGHQADEQGVGFEERAITQYKNAWLHALNAGASAVTALEVMESD